MMNFDRHGLDEFPLGMDYVEAFFRLQDPEEMEVYKRQNCVGRYAINGRVYSMSLAEERGTGVLGYVGVGLLYGDDTFEGIEVEKLSTYEFLKALRRMDSLPRVVSNTIFWPEQLMTFYTSDDTVQAIGWHTKVEFYKYLENATQNA